VTKLGIPEREKLNGSSINRSGACNGALGAAISPMIRFGERRAVVWLLAIVEVMAKDRIECRPHA
jgi:hypothetical protein